MPETPRFAGAAPVRDGLAPIGVTIPEALRLARQRLEAGFAAQAESIALEVLAADPDEPDALQLCGVIAHLAGKSALALALVEKAHRLAPQDAQILYNLGVIQNALGRRAAAFQSYREVIERAPRHVDALHNLGNLAFEDDDWALAESSYARALSLRPNDPQLQLARGLLAMTRRELELAESHFANALVMAPKDIQIAWEAAAFYLLKGDYARGWSLYEQRFAAASRSQAYHYPFTQPLWRGESLAGRHLLVHGEQGLGDEIMFLSLVPELLDLGARVTLVGAPPLTPLWRHVFAHCTCHAQARVDGAGWTRTTPLFLEQVAADAPDYQIPCASLALWRRRSAADFKRQMAYVEAAPILVRQWAAWLAMGGAPAAAGRLRVGLVWAGHPGHHDAQARRKDARRSLPAAQLAPLSAVAGVDWVSLQLGALIGNGRIEGAALKVIDASAGLTDFAQTAALVANLDLVITVDTAVAHLAGAMGKPVWVLLPFAGEWRWGTNETRAPWWPSALLFRQARPGAWDDAVKRVMVRLNEEVASR